MEKIRRLPAKLRKLELGQLYNGINNEFIGFNCLDLELTQQNDLLKLSNNEIRETFSFSHQNDSSSENSVLNIGGGAKGAGWGVSLEASYSHYNEKASTANSNVIKADVYKVKTASIELYNYLNEPEKILESLRESSFKKDWESIRKEKNSASKKLKIQKFKQKWGTGMIVKLDLAAGAMAQLEFESKSGNEKSTNVHEAGMKLESSIVSAKGELRISNDSEKFNLNVNQVGNTVCFPDEIEPYKKYVDAQLDYFKAYIEKKDITARKPDFQGASAIKAIDLKELVVKKVSADELNADLRKKITEQLTRVRKMFVNSDQAKLVVAIDSINRIDSEYTQIYTAENADLHKAFDQIKVDFKAELLQVLKDEKKFYTSLKGEYALLCKMWIKPEGKRTLLFESTEEKTLLDKLKS